MNHHFHTYPFTYIFAVVTLFIGLVWQVFYV